jgi:hypothetical protein
VGGIDEVTLNGSDSRNESSCPFRTPDPMKMDPSGFTFNGTVGSG